MHYVYETEPSPKVASPGFAITMKKLGILYLKIYTIIRMIVFFLLHILIYIIILNSIGQSYLFRTMW